MQILTEEGFQDFDGFVNQGKRNDLHRLTLSNNETLKCTPDHELRMSTGEYIQLQNLSIGDVLYNEVEVLNIELLNEEEYVYDALNVSNTNSYITNGVVSHNCLVMDEFAAVDPPWKAEQFWISVYPTVSASKTSKVIIISTAKGLHNQFHRIWIEAEKGLSAFTPVFYDWRVVPGRDDEWAEKEKKTIGAIPFSQEYDCKFLGSTHTVIEASTLEKLINKGITEPELVQLGGHFRIYEQPQKGSQYIMGVDTSKGTGLDYSTIQVLKIESLQPLKLKQVAVYENNMIDPYGFAEIVNKTSLYYNKAYIMVENNGEGSVIVNQLWWEYENESLVNEGSKIAKLGVRATTRTKPKAVMLMKKLVEDEAIEIIDKNTLTQFTDFQDLGNNRFACKNMHDDLVSSLYWAIYFFELNILSEDFKMHKGLFDTVGEEDEELDGWGLLGDVENEEESWDWLTRIGA